MGLLLQLAGAVALLLWAIRMVQTGFSRLLGNRLERTLRKTTGHRLMAFTSGGGTAFLLQSSTAVVLMVAGFSQAGMMTLKAGMATVLGAEFGASLAAVLLNLDIKLLALPLVLAGFVVFNNSENRAYKHSARVMIGLGLVLLSLSLIGDQTQGLGDSDIFQVIISRLEADAFLAVFMMGLLTWLLHSTLAAVLLIAQLVQDDSVSLTAGLYLVLGANLGGAMPALVAGWSMKTLGRRIVLSNLFFRGCALLLGVLAITLLNGIWLPAAALGGFAVILAHSGLNLVNGLLLLSALPWIAPWFKPDDRVDTSVDLYQDADQPIYLALDDIQNPKRALANTRNEALHIADLVYRMLNNAVDAFDDKNLIRQISEMDDDIDRLHREAMNYALSIKEIDQKEGYRRSREEIISFMTNLEHIGDIIDESLMHLARHKQKENVQFTEEQTAVINQLHEELVDSFRLSQAVFTSDSGELAQELLSAKRSYRKEVLSARQAHIDQLGGHHRENLVSTQIFMDVLRDLQRICSHLTAVAYPVLKRKQLLETSEQ